MKTSARNSWRTSGSVLIYSLILMAVAAVVLAGLMQVMASRALYTEQLSAGIRQRIVLENSRLMASEYLLENVLPGSFSAAASASLPDDWGGFTLTAPTGTEVPLTSILSVSPSNRFSPGAGEGFTVEIAATLYDGNSSFPWLFKARSSTPMFGYDLLSSQKPTLSPSAQIDVGSGIAVDNNTVIWSSQSPNTFGMTTGTYQTPTVNGIVMTPPTDGGGFSLAMSNFAFVPVTSGVVGGGLGYDGALSVIAGGSSGVPYTSSLLYKAGGPIVRADVIPHLSVYSDADTGTAPNPSVNLAENPPQVSPVGGVSSNGTGTVTIDLSVAASARIYIYGDIEKLILKGDLLATADYSGGPTNDKSPGPGGEVDDRNSLLIVYVQPAASARDLVNIDLTGANNRRVYLAVKKEGASPTTVNVNLAATALWRLGAVFENAPALFKLGGNTLQLVGGLRSDASLVIEGSNGAIQVFRELDPDPQGDSNMTAIFADRIAWLESYRQ